MYTIYGMLNESGKVVYVGATKQSLKRRLWCHWGARNRSNRRIPVNEWMKSLESMPKLVELDTATTTLEAAEKEAYWIDRYGGIGVLLNVRKSGGRSLEGSVRDSSSLKGVPKTEEHKRKIGAAHKGKKLSQEQIDALRRANLGKKVSKETLRKQAAAQAEWQSREDKTPRICDVCGKGPYRGSRSLNTHKGRYHKNMRH